MARVRYTNFFLPFIFVFVFRIAWYNYWTLDGIILCYNLPFTSFGNASKFNSGARRGKTACSHLGWRRLDRNIFDVTTFSY